jgi:uncharacterized protein YjgD (DUF1641 family)
MTMSDNTSEIGSIPELERVMQAAKDSISDDMVSRLAENGAQALDLLDRLNRSGIDRALPVLTRLVENGDLQRIVDIARTVAAAEDAMNDDMVGRVAQMGAEALSVIDRLNRSGVERLIDLLDRLNNSGSLDILADKLPSMIKHIDMVDQLAGCLNAGAEDARQLPPPPGGLMAMLHLMGDAENQAALQFLMSVGKRMRTSCSASKG